MVDEARHRVERHCPCGLHVEEHIGQELLRVQSAAYSQYPGKRRGFLNKGGVERWERCEILRQVPSIQGSSARALEAAGYL